MHSSWWFLRELLNKFGSYRINTLCILCAPGNSTQNHYCLHIIMMIILSIVQHSRAIAQSLITGLTRTHLLEHSLSSPVDRTTVTWVGQTEQQRRTFAWRSLYWVYAADSCTPVQSPDWCNCVGRWHVEEICGTKPPCVFWTSPMFYWPSARCNARAISKQERQ